MDKINILQESETRQKKQIQAVLIVDDDPMLLMIAEKMIDRLGFFPIKAKDGLEAIEVFEQHRNVICCVICDIFMPQMNGWSTISALRNIDPGVLVILSSGSIPDQTASHEQAELPDAFLAKPYRIETLHRMINKVLNGQ